MQSTHSLLLTALVASVTAGLIWHFPTNWLMKCLWKKFYTLPNSGQQIGGEDIHRAVQPFIILLGIIERMVYAGSWLLGAPQVIGLVLALKAAPLLKEWSDAKVVGRTQFNIWLTGNLFSIMGSVLIAELVRLWFVTEVH